MTATQPPGRFGAINHDGNRVTGFQEKPSGDGGWINGGFFVLSPKVGDYIDGDATDLGKGADGESRQERPVECVLPRRILASDGYAARQTIS